MWRTRLRYCCMAHCNELSVVGCRLSPPDRQPKPTTGNAPRSGAYNRAPMLRVGQIAAADLANRFGTPLYVYDAAVIRRQVERVKRAFGSLPFRPFYAMKANGSLA